MVWLLPKTSLLQSFQLTWIKRFNAQRCNEGIKEPVRRKWGFFRQRAVCPLEKKEEQNKRGNEYNKKAVPHLWKHKSGTASYFRFLSVWLNRLKNKLLTEYLRNRGNDLATVRISAFCVAMLSNNSLRIQRYNNYSENNAYYRKNCILSL